MSEMQPVTKAVEKEASKKGEVTDVHVGREILQYI